MGRKLILIALLVFSSAVAGAQGDATSVINFSSGNRGPQNAPSQFSGKNTGYGYDVRAFGAKLDGTTDDSAAVASCLATFQWCWIPATTTGATTKLRWASPQVLTGTGSRRLSCAGSQNNGFTNNNGDVEISVDMGFSAGGTPGPALMLGTPNAAPFDGITIDKSCHWRDVSSGHNSPGAIGNIDVSNVYINSGFDGFRRPPLATTTVSPAAIASCSNTGGSIASGGSLWRIDQALGPGYGPSPKSAVVTATLTSMGCTSGSTCSCTPTAPTTIDSSAVADTVFLGTSAGNQFQAGMPYVCSNGTCPMTQNFNYGTAATSSSVLTAIPSSGNTPDTFDHSGGYGAYMTGTAGWNCGNHGDACASNQFVNQPSFLQTECDNNYVCLDFDNKIAAGRVTDAHINLNTNNGQTGILTESGIIVTGGHFEGGSAGSVIGGTNGSITSGAAVLTSASNPFLSTMVGNWVSISNAGTAGGLFTTYITGFTNTGSITLAKNAVTTTTTGVMTILPGPMIKVTGNSSSIFQGVWMESGNAIAAIQAVGATRDTFAGLCGNALAVCFIDDAASSNNIVQMQNFVGTNTIQSTDSMLSGGNLTVAAINKLTLTPPANGSTITIADGKTFTLNNTLTFSGTDASSVALGAGGTVLYSGGALGTPASGTLTNVTGLPVNGLVSATGAIPTIANGNNPLTMNSAQTTNTQSAVTFGETTAATGGSGDNEVTVSTQSNSASTALNISCGAPSTVFPTACHNYSQGSNTGATNVPLINATGTWNNGSIAGPWITYALTNTSSTAGSVFLQLMGGASGTTSEFSVTTGGAVQAAGAIKSGTFESTGVTNSTSLCGGQCTSSANSTAGALTVQGSDDSNTGGSAAGGALTLRAGDLSGAATNLPGAAVVIRSGLGTGNATPATVKIQSPTLGLASGTAAETSVTRYVTHVKAGSTTSATATNLFNIASATNTAWGLKITVHVDLISSTPNVCGTTEEFSLTGTNNNGTFGTVNVVAGTLSTLCSAGTLTLAVGATAANPSVISVTPTWATITSITSATITVQIQNVSQQEIALL